MLDLMLTNSPGLHDVTVSVPLGTSDHSVITSLIKGSIVPTIKKGHRQIFLYSKADWNGLMGYFCKFAWKKLLHNLSVDEACALITKVITDGVQRFVPSKRVKNKHMSCPWFNEECSASFKAKDKAFKNMQTCASIANKAEYHACKYRYQQVIRDAKTSYASELEDRFNSCTYPVQIVICTPVAVKLTSLLSSYYHQYFNQLNQQINQSSLRHPTIRGIASN